MGDSPFVLSSAERVALDTIREDRPEVLSSFSEWVARVLDDLMRTSQGRVVTHAEADELLLRLREELVGRMLTATEPWGEDEEVREAVVDLLAQHLIAEARPGFVRRVVAAVRN